MQIALRQFDCIERRRKIEVQHRKHGGNRAPGQLREGFIIATAEIMTIVPQGKRDAALVARCETFINREWHYTAKDMASNGKLSDDEMAERDAELYPMADRLCRSRARTLNGIRARVRTLLAIAPHLFEKLDPDYDPYDQQTRLLNALLRDLRTVLKATPDTLTRGEA